MLPTLVRNWHTPFDLLREEFDRMTDRNGGAGMESYGTYGAYPVDIREDEGHIYVDAELPGFKREEIELTLENGVLTIGAERKVTEQQGTTTHLAQRRYTHVCRKFSLPNTVDESKVDAKLVDGVLHLTLTKREEVRPRKIEVK